MFDSPCIVDVLTGVPFNGDGVPGDIRLTGLERKSFEGDVE